MKHGLDSPTGVVVAAALSFQHSKLASPTQSPARLGFGLQEHAVAQMADFGKQTAVISPQARPMEDRPLRTRAQAEQRLPTNPSTAKLTISGEARSRPESVSATTTRVFNTAVVGGITPLQSAEGVAADTRRADRQLLQQNPREPQSDGAVPTLPASSPEQTPAVASAVPEAIAESGGPETTKFVRVATETEDTDENNNDASNTPTLPSPALTDTITPSRSLYKLQTQDLEKENEMIHHQAMAQVDEVTKGEKKLAAKLEKQQRKLEKLLEKKNLQRVKRFQADTDRKSMAMANEALALEEQSAHLKRLIAAKAKRKSMKRLKRQHSPAARSSIARTSKHSNASADNKGAAHSHVQRTSVPMHHLPANANQTATFACDPSESLNRQSASAAGPSAAGASADSMQASFGKGGDAEASVSDRTIRSWPRETSVAVLDRRQQLGFSPANHRRQQHGRELVGATRLFPVQHGTWKRVAISRVFRIRFSSSAAAGIEVVARRAIPSELSHASNGPSRLHDGCE